MTDQLSGAPPYVVDGVRFDQWVVDRTKQPGTSRYEWRDATNRLRVGKSAGRFWATVNGVEVRGQFFLWSQAMRAAVQSAGMRKAA